MRFRRNPALSRVVRGLLPAAVGFLLAGCSSVINSHAQKEEMMSDYLKGDNEGALDEIDYKLREPAWYNSSVVDTGDELVWRLEAGSMNFHLGNFREAIDQLKIAEDLIELYDERADVSARDVGAEVGAALTNLNALPYRGYCRDRIALAVYKALAYLGTGNEEAFHAQIRRLRNEQKKVQDDYSKFFEQEKARLEEEMAQNPEAAKKTEETGTISGISGSPDNIAFKNGMTQVREIANKGYGNFLNPAAIFLSGLGSVRDGNYDNARVDFQRLSEAMPNNPLFRKYYVTVMKKAGRELPDYLADVEPFDFPLDEDCVFVVFANGHTAALQEISIYFPIMTAWPMCEFYDAPFRDLVAEAGGKKYSSMILADMDGILAQEFDERLPGMITRIVLNTLIKEAAYYAGIAVIAAQKDMDPTVQAVALASVAIGGAAYRYAMNTADTRSWEILPKEFQLTQFPMPKDKQVKLNLNLAGGMTVSQALKLPDDCRSAIIFVDAPSVQNVAFHVLPIKSK
jgi:hypothetical protein